MPRRYRRGRIDTGAGAAGSGHLTIDDDRAVRYVTRGQGGCPVGRGMLTGVISRHTTFRFCLNPTVEQNEVLARHGGAARFAFNQCLRLVKTTLTHRRTDPDTDVPWTGFDLINAFNAWKKTENAGRVFTVDSEGMAQTCRRLNSRIPQR